MGREIFFGNDRFPSFFLYSATQRLGRSTDNENQMFGMYIMFLRRNYTKRKCGTYEKFSCEFQELPQENLEIET